MTVRPTAPDLQLLIEVGGSPFTEFHKEQGTLSQKLPDSDILTAVNMSPTFRMTQSPPALTGSETGATKTSRPTTIPSRISTAENPTPRSRRGQYVSKACVHCQQRKVKCSGHSTCEQCKANDLLCHYQRRKRSSERRSRDQRKANVNHQNGSNAQGAKQDATLEKMLATMAERIATLEQSCSSLQLKLQMSSSRESPSNLVNPATDSTTSLVSRSRLSIPAKEGFRGDSSMLHQFEALQESMKETPDYLIYSQQQSRLGTPDPVAWETSPQEEQKGFDVLEQQLKDYASPSLETAVNIYFQHINPLYGALNEAWFRRKMADFVESVPSAEPDDADKYQFVALLYLMHAEILIVTERRSSSTHAPGWEQYSRADTLLAPLTWLGQGNWVTFHCYLIAARYLMFAENSKAAHDKVSKAVSLCWHLGLHDQRLWTESLPFDIIMKQRVFWALFHIERITTFCVGAPYLLRRSDFNVGLPPNIDDRDLAKGQIIPAETLDAGPQPFIQAIAKWGDFCAEIWDNVFCASAPRPWNKSFIADVDRRIVQCLEDLPDCLHWKMNRNRTTEREPRSELYFNQSGTLVLRMNHLRLMLRQDNMLQLTHDDVRAAECVSITSQSIEIAQILYRDSSTHPPDRFTLTWSLVGCLIPLVCVILRKQTNMETRRAGASVFEQTYALLREMAPHFSAVRHTLRRLRKIIATTEKAIRTLDESESISSLPSIGGFEDIPLDMTAFLGINAEMSFNEHFFHDPRLGEFLGDVDISLDNNSSGDYDYSMNGQTWSWDTF